MNVPWLHDVEEEAPNTAALMVRKETLPYLLEEMRHRNKNWQGQAVKDVQVDLSEPEALDSVTGATWYPILEAPLMHVGIVAAIDRQANVLAVYRVPLGRN